MLFKHTVCCVQENEELSEFVHGWKGALIQFCNEFRTVRRVVHVAWAVRTAAAALAPRLLRQDAAELQVRVDLQRCCV